MKSWHKVGIGIVIAVIVLVGLGVLARAGLRSFFYPIAPPMPAVVSEPMPEILARLESILKTNAPQVLAGLQPGLSDGDISKLEQQYHVQLPDDIQAIYQWHNGSARTTNFLSGDFIPGHRFLLLEEALAERAASSAAKASWLQRLAYKVLAGHRDSWIYLFSDGAGDGYGFDPKRKPAEGAVFYNFTETATCVFFPSAKNLMAGVAQCFEQGAFRIKQGSSPPQLDEDFEKAAKIWEEFGASNQPR
jgi:cell wall assembly regulator SMI1